MPTAKRRKRKKSKPVYWGAGGQIPRGYHGPSQLRTSGVAPRASAYFGGSLTRSGFASSGAHAYAQGRVQQMRLPSDIPQEYTPPEEVAYRAQHKAALHGDAQGAVPGQARSSAVHRREYAAAAFNLYREPQSFASSAQSSPTLSPESPLYSGSGSGGGGGGGGGASADELAGLFDGLDMSPIGQPTPEATQRRRRSGTREQQEAFAVEQPVHPRISPTLQALSQHTMGLLQTPSPLPRSAGSPSTGSRTPDSSSSAHRFGSPAAGRAQALRLFQAADDPSSSIWGNQAAAAQPSLASGREPRSNAGVPAHRYGTTPSPQKAPPRSRIPRPRVHVPAHLR